jgi:dihydrofolate synthase/folylpolyglutamate synthase
VIEVGLGGRLDATNVITPVACAITRIDYDHMDKLGHALGEIAREKAGIIKPGVPVVTGPQRPAAMREILRRTRPLVPSVWPSRSPGTVVKFTVEGVRGKIYRGRLPLLGRHQADNAAVAIALVEASGAEVTSGEVREALRRVRLPGRIELVARRPCIIVDVAHNPVSARALAEAIRRVPPRRRTILIFGASADKEYTAMLRTLEPLADLTILTRAQSPRAAAPETLARVARGLAVRTESVGQAVALARTVARPADAIVVAGSFYVAGEALASLSRTT